MWRHPVLKICLLVYIGWGGWNWFTNRPVHPPDGVLAPKDPEQTNRAGGEQVRVGRESIITHSANTHVIPLNPAVSRQLSRLRPGQVVTLSGRLVDGVRDDGMRIRTSMVRDDTGAGACEVLLVGEVALAE
jgi:hypothetical protein